MTELSFEGKSFCFAGKFESHERSELRRLVEGRGAESTADVTEGTDYLVVGNQGTRCCTFGCCERKVEKAKRMVGKTASPLILSEDLFFESIRGST